MKISWYVTREILLSFLTWFLVIFLIFFINQFLLLADEILSKKAPILDVLLLLMYSLPAVLALSAPFATLFGVMFALGRLASDREILASQACGVSHRFLFVPTAVLGLAFTFGSYVMNDVLLPVGAINFGKVYKKLILSTPELELGSYTVKFYKNLTLITGEVKDRTVNGLVIIDKVGQEANRVISAKQASLLDDPNQPGVLTIAMKDIVGVVPDARRYGNYDYFIAKDFQYNIVLNESQNASQNVGPREMSSVDLWKQIQAKSDETKLAIQQIQVSIASLKIDLAGEYWTSAPFVARAEKNVLRQSLALRIQEMQSRDFTDRVLQNWKTEFYQKFSIPLGCISFVLLAYPLVNLVKRGGRMVVIIYAFIISFFYWASLLGARTLAMEWLWLPEITIFLPNILIVIFGIFLFRRLFR